VIQQSSKPTGENWSFDPDRLDLICISVHLLVLGVARGSVLLVALVLYPLAAVAPQQASPELLGSQEPPALSQKVLLRVMPLVVRRARTPGVVARSEVPADQRAVGRCSSVRYGECEPSII
jgi:hypothetical protein